MVLGMRKSRESEPVTISQDAAEPVAGPEDPYMTFASASGSRDRIAVIIQNAERTICMMFPMVDVADYNINKDSDLTIVFKDGGSFFLPGRKYQMVYMPNLEPANG